MTSKGWGERLIAHQKVLNKKLIAATWMKDHLDDARKLRSLNVQKLILKKIMIANDIVKDVLDAYHYAVCYATLVYRFASAS